MFDTKYGYIKTDIEEGKYTFLFYVSFRYNSV